MTTTIEASEALVARLEKTCDRIEQLEAHLMPLLELKEDPELAGMPLVVFSGLSANQAKAECLALGADDYLEKPVDPELNRPGFIGD